MKNLRGASRWLFLSFALHATFLSTLIVLSKWGRVEAPSSREIPVVTEAPELVAAAPSISLFNGVSFAAFHARKAEVVKETKKTNQLLKQLKGLSFGVSGSTGASLKSAADQAARGDGGGGKPALELTQSIQKHAFHFEAKPVSPKAGQRAMTDREKAELRKNFRALEGELRKLYARALNDDPHLEITLAFDAVVQSSGFLQVAQFRPSGSFRPESLALFRGRMGELIGRIFVAKDLNGALIRGESVFVK